MLTDIDQTILREGAQDAKGAKPAKRHQCVDYAIEQVRARNPRAFLTKADMAKRKFFDEPHPDVPNAGFAVPASPDIRREWELATRKGEGK